ncbi:MAG: hypothetical protein JEZ01_00300 [Labilibaculum sp.]|nr:hypothetical protein [Labilibaculum sp.]MBI9056186.1 hypothetical protein [Labilibaculum sp.]
MKFKSLFILFLIPFFSFSQDQKLTLDGYLKDLHMYYHPEQLSVGPELHDFNINTIHNRLNLNWFANDKMTFTLGMRNRFISGNAVSDIPNYKSSVDFDNGFLDLSWITTEGNNSFLHSIFDRAYIDYSTGNWQIRLGRQRINWGINLVWNPNDVFNSFSYFDFDYEERPGSDAINIRHYIGATSSVEIVYKIAKSTNEMALAAMYRFSYNNYDYQFISGWVGDDYMIGGGYTGSIKGGGFRGEITHFFPRTNQTNSQESTVASISYDYTLKNNLYLSIEGLYNSKGTTGDAGGSNLLLTQNLSAKQLSLAKYSLFAQASIPINPLFNAGIAAILNPSDNSWYLSPSCRYSIHENIELMITTQLFFGKERTEFGDIGQLAFARIRWSF